MRMAGKSSNQITRPQPYFYTFVPGGRDKKKYWKDDVRRFFSVDTFYDILWGTGWVMAGLFLPIMLSKGVWW